MTHASGSAAGVRSVAGKSDARQPDLAHGFIVAGDGGGVARTSVARVPALATDGCACLSGRSRNRDGPVVRLRQGRRGYRPAPGFSLPRGARYAARR